MHRIVLRAPVTVCVVLKKAPVTVCLVCEIMRGMGFEPTNSYETRPST